MKIVHLTDLHYQVPPRVDELWGKRFLGSVNLYLLGRHSKFSRQVQDAAIRRTVEEAPDIVVFTGDLTAQALDSEFSEARQALEPILSRFPTIMIPGNHDTYVRESTPGIRMRELFGEWMGETSPWLHCFDELAFLSVETCRSHPLSSGLTPTGELDRARSCLEAAGDRFVFLCIHYPLRDRRGAPYGPRTRALSNASSVERFVSESPQVDVILHGHEHHGFQTRLDVGGRQVPILNPGASGYAHLPDKNRTAHLNVYQADRTGISSIRRLRFMNGEFEEEPGGAYATGR
jgi:3',5'-cyclic AMP phosphodiesterase CpdA